MGIFEDRVLVVVVEAVPQDIVVGEQSTDQDQSQRPTASIGDLFHALTIPSGQCSHNL